MEKILMLYSIGNDVKRIQFNRKLFSYKTKTQGGKYSSTTKGILDKYEKPMRSVILFEITKLKHVKELCKKDKISAIFYRVSEIV